MQELVRLNGNVPLRMLLDILYYIRCNGFHSAPLWLKVEKAAALHLKHFTAVLFSPLKV